MEVREAKIEGEGIIILCILVLPTIKPGRSQSEGLAGWYHNHTVQ